MINDYLSVVFHTLVISCYSIGKGSESIYTCVGNQFLLTCTTLNGSTITWEINSPNSNNLANTVQFSLSGVTNLSNATIGNTTFNFFKSSISPLTSTILIDNVTSDVDGVRVNCRHQGGNESIVIHVVEGVPDVIVSASEEYGVDIVTVQLEYDKKTNVLVTYNVSLLDMTTQTPTSFTGFEIQNSSILLSLNISYNTVYNISVKAHCCGESSERIFTLHYGDSSDALVMGYSDPALVGSNVTITCLTRDEDTGNYSETAMALTCMSDGRWSPDPLIGCNSGNHVSVHTNTACVKKE